MLQLKAAILQHSDSVMNLKDETLYTSSPKRPRSRCIPEDFISPISITLHDNSDKKESNDKKEHKKQNEQVRKCTIYLFLSVDRFSSMLLIRLWGTRGTGRG